MVDAGRNFFYEKINNTRVRPPLEFPVVHPHVIGPDGACCICISKKSPTFRSFAVDPVLHFYHVVFGVSFFELQLNQVRPKLVSELTKILVWYRNQNLVRVRCDCVISTHIISIVFVSVYSTNFPTASQFFLRFHFHDLELLTRILSERAVNITGDPKSETRLVYHF